MSRKRKPSRKMTMYEVNQTATALLTAESMFDFETVANLIAECPDPSAVLAEMITTASIYLDRLTFYGPATREDYLTALGRSNEQLFGPDGLAGEQS